MNNKIYRNEKIDQITNSALQYLQICYKQLSELKQIENKVTNDNILWFFNRAWNLKCQTKNDKFISFAIKFLKLIEDNESLDIEFYKRKCICLIQQSEYNIDQIWSNNPV